LVHLKEFEPYYPQGNMQAKLTNKTLGKILVKLVNANQMDWDVMLVTTLRAYWMVYKVTTQYKLFEFVYGTQPIMLAKFAGSIKRVCDVPQEHFHST
jgi:hypothetical protein